MKKMLVMIILALTIMMSFNTVHAAAPVRIAPAGLRADTNESTNGSIGVKDPGTWPAQPGTVKYGSKLNSTAIFYQNDYYLSGGAKYPYQYAVSIWQNNYNQRVTVKVTVYGCSCGWNEYFSGEKPVAQLSQEKDWVPSGYNGTGAQTGWIKADTWDIQTSSSGSYQVYWPATATFSFLTNSTSYRPGLFKISVKFYIGYWTGGGYWYKALDIYGLFTYGDANGDVKKVVDDVNGTNIVQLDYVINSGKWHITFWYGGEAPDQFQINKDHVTGTNAQEMKDFGIFTPDNPPPRPLEYRFNDSDPAGMYVWLVYSVYGNNELLYSWTATIHNNKTVLAGNEPPAVQISFSGKPEINKDLTIQITVSDDNSTTLNFWVVSFYSRNVYMAPDPSTSLVQQFFSAYSADNGKTVNITVKLLYGGQFNVWVVVKDANNAWNIARAAIAVQDFEGGTGGAGTDIGGDPWFAWPWSSTLNMVILVVGIVMMFSGKRTLQVIGIVLLFASFVNWAYLPTAIHDYIQKAIPWPHLEVWL